MKFRSVSSSCSSSTGDLLWKLKHTWNSSVLGSAWSSAPSPLPFLRKMTSSLWQLSKRAQCITWDLFLYRVTEFAKINTVGSLTIDQATKALSVIIWNNWSGSVLCCCRLSSNFLTYFFTQVLLKRVFENFSFMIPQLFCFHYIHFKTLVSIRCADFTYFFSYSGRNCYNLLCV